jgi:RNA polymerase sigma-70 factor, ECF subfamily
MQESTRPDSELIAEFRRGRTAAFDLLVRRYEQPLFGFLMNLVQDEALANDLFQDTFVRIIERIDSYEESGKFRSWLFQVARNLAMDVLRRRQLERGIFSASAEQNGEHPVNAPEEGIANQLFNPDTVLENTELRVRLTRAIAELPDDQREVLTLRLLSGITFREIAEITHTSINTITGRMRYATEKLRISLSEYAREDE